MISGCWQERSVHFVYSLSIAARNKGEMQNVTAGVKIDRETVVRPITKFSRLEEDRKRNLSAYGTIL